MPRQPRLDSGGAIYHIIARGIERRAIFADDQDHKEFMTRLSTVLIDTTTPLYAFCLIPNHFHLLIRREKYSISTVMRRLLTSYALYFNKRHNRAGHLFQNRYKAIICQEDSYLFELIRYINLNPVRAKLVKTIEDLASYPFSGHPYMLGGKGEDWFDAQALLSHFSRSQRKAKSLYLNFLRDGLDLKPDLEGGGLKRSIKTTNYPREKQAFDDRVLGDSEFVENLLLLEEKKDESSKFADVSATIAMVCREYNVDESEVIGKSKRAPVVKARTALVSRIARETELSGSQIAKTLKLTRSAVSKIMSSQNVRDQ